MKLYITGQPSGYELEHVARLFFPAGELAKAYPAHRADAVVVRLSKRRMLCAVRANGLVALRCVPRAPGTEKETEYAHAKLLYLLLCEFTGKRPAWGMLTGVRPVRLVHDMRRRGFSEEAIERWFCEDYFVTSPRFALARHIADVQMPLIAKSKPNSYSLYLSIPFCPSRCSYCSFVSRTTGESGKLIAPYVDALCKELADIRAVADRNGLHLETVYIGGGTPTAISAQQLRQLMQSVRDTFDLTQVAEYTVEAGRPDCTDAEKLAVMKEYGATRISINPQTLSDEVLRAIGRRHTAQDIIDCFDNARKAGHQNINMDLIAGLPKDTVEGFVQSLSGVMALGPENITVHTLTLKRASNLVIEGTAAQYDDVAQMVRLSQEMLRGQYEPYYLYRQKGTLQNLENVGYTKPGFAGLYNVYIMEEVHTILSAGAGGSTKLVAPHGTRIDRIFNHKYPLEYLERFDVVRERKKGVDDFYAQFPHLDPEAPR